jgi:hypothetical protein
VIKGGTEEHLFCADGAAEPVNVSKKGSKAKSAAQNGADDVSTYEGECWAFSSRYLKPTQAALQLALDAIEVHALLYKSIFLVICVGLSSTLLRWQECQGMPRVLTLPKHWPPEMNAGKPALIHILQQEFVTSDNCSTTACLHSQICSCALYTKCASCLRSRYLLQHAQQMQS